MVAAGKAPMTASDSKDDVADLEAVLEEIKETIEATRQELRSG